MGEKNAKEATASNFDDGLDLTPRAATAPVSTPTLSDTSSSVSRASSASPKKQLMSLRLSDSGVEIKALKVDSPYTSKAKELISSIRDIGRAIDILPSETKASILNCVNARGLDTREWRYSFQSAEDIDQLPGRIPSFEEVERIHRKATECQEEGHEEFSWNSQVHLRLLEAVFEDIHGQCDAFGSMTW